MTVLDSVRLVTRPWLKFGTTGTAAAGEANSSSNALAALKFTDDLTDCTGIRTTCRQSNRP